MNKNNLAFEKDWTHGLLPPAQRGYGLHVNYGKAQDVSKIFYGAGNQALIVDALNPGKVDVFNGHNAKVRVVCPSPSGAYVASGDEMGVVHVYSTLDYSRPRNTLNIGSRINDIRWSGDSKRIIAAGAGYNELAKAFNFDMQNPLGKIDLITKPVLSCDWSPGMPHRVVTVDEDRVVNVYNGVPFKHSGRSAHHTNFVNIVRYAPNGSVFATTGSDSKIFLYDGKTGEMVRQLEDKENGHAGSIYGLAWSPDSSELVTTGGDKTAKIWNVEQGKVVHTFQIPSDTGKFDAQQVCVMWGDDGQVVTVSIAGVISFWSRDQEKPVRVVHGHKIQPVALAVSRSQGKVFTSDSEGRITSWDSVTGEGHWVANVPSSAASMVSSKDGNSIFVGSVTGDVYTIDVATNAFGKFLHKCDDDIKSVCLSHDGKSLVFTSGRGEIGLIKDGQYVTSVNVGTGNAVNGTFSTDDSTLYIAGGTSKVMFVIKADGNTLTDVKKSANITSYDCHTVAANDKYVVSNQGTLIHFWNEDFSDSNSLTWNVHRANVTSMKWSPDNKILATGAADGDILLWSNFGETVPKPKILSQVAPIGVVDFEWIDDKSLAVVTQQGFVTKVTITEEF